MENVTTGHSAAAGGLRGHSMGDTYPITVIGQGEGFVKFNLLTGEAGPVRSTYDEAFFWEELTIACPAECPRTRHNGACATCSWFTTARKQDIGQVRLELLKGVAA